MLRYALAVGLVLARAALALDTDDKDVAKRYGIFGGGNPYSGGGYNGDGDGFAGISGTSLHNAIHYRTVHGILASVAMVVLFPVGSIILRVVPGRCAIWIHAVFQTMAYALYIAGAALGIYLVRTVRLPLAGGGSLLTNAHTSYHPILGLLTLATLFVQPMLGYIHHVRFKQLGRRTVWSHLHLWNGRLGITIGIVDGGLGLQLAHAPQRTKTAYIAVAVVLWALWMLVALASEAKRARTTPAAAVHRRPVAHARRRGSYTPEPEMAAARTPGADSSHAPPARPPRSSDRSPKARQSHSTQSRNSPTRVG